MADNRFIQFDNINYHQNQMTTYRDQTLETGRNLGMDNEDEIENAIETNFENLDPGLKLSNSFRVIHSLMSDYLEEMRRTNGLGNNRQHLFGLRHMLTVYNNVLPHDFNNAVREWTQYRLDTFHYDDAH